MTNDNQKTPEWILDIFKGWFDPCPSEYKRDGLKIRWRDRTYVNPPYSKPKPWIVKAIEENKKGKIIAMLLPVDTSTEWFRMLVEAKAHILLPNERLRFNGSKTPARWACMIVILNKEKIPPKNETKRRKPTWHGRW